MGLRMSLERQGHDAEKAERATDIHEEFDQTIKSSKTLCKVFSHYILATLTIISEKVLETKTWMMKQKKKKTWSKVRPRSSILAQI
jgi:hypothetical protein